MTLSKKYYTILAQTHIILSSESGKYGGRGKMVTIGNKRFKVMG